MMDKAAVDIRAQAAKRKQTIVSALIIFLLIPLTIWFGIRFLDDRKYLFISLSPLSCGLRDAGPTRGRLW